MMHRMFMNGFASGLLLAAQGSAHAADNPTPLPEVEATGYRTLLQLREAISEAEDAMYGLWNEINDDRLFEIVCIREARTGTLIKRKKCTPRFVGEATAEVAREFFAQKLANPAASFGLMSADAMVQFYTPILERKMKEAILENPQFLEAILKHNELQEELKERQRSRARDE